MHATDSTMWVADDKSVVDAYVYLLGRALVIRQEHADLAEPGMGYNVVKHNAQASAEFVNPNFDVLNLEAWIAPDEHTPVILEVPQIEGRYYTAQILDEWGDVILNINPRTLPSQSHGRFAFVTLGSSAAVPADAARIELRSGKAKLLGRVELRGEPDKARALQTQFKLHAARQPRVSPALELPAITPQSLVGAELFAYAESMLRSALDVSPVAAAMQTLTRHVAALIGTPAGRERVEAVIQQQAIPKLRSFLTSEGGLVRNNWITSVGIGNFGANYWLRTSINLMGIWANVVTEVQYFMAMIDAAGQRLNGNTAYQLHFPADALPSEVVNGQCGYWSLSLISLPDYRAVPNALNRYSLNPYSHLAFESDGSLKLQVSAVKPEGTAQSNWLPSPAGRPFALNFRTYVPKAAVTSGHWFPPVLQATSELGVKS